MRHLGWLLAAVILAAGVAGCMPTRDGCPCGAAGKVIARVNCGATEEYTDETGAVWSADQVWAEGKTWGAVGGLTVKRTFVKPIEGTKAPQVYLTERYEMAGYRFAVPAGTYHVRLHFAETFEGVSMPGERVFSVKIEGQEVLKGFDPIKEAGKFATPVVKEFKDVKVTDGTLNVEFVTDRQLPEINGIEVIHKQ
jgi:hypothetical protein